MDLEREVVQFFKSLVFNFFEKKGKRDFDIALFGGTVLDYYNESKIDINTLDLDVHIYSKTGGNADIMRDRFAKSCVEFLENAMKRNKGVGMFFASKTNEPPFKIIHLRAAKVQRIVVYGFDLMDIKYEYTDPKDTIALFGIKLIRPEVYVESQLVIFKQPFNSVILKDKYRLVSQDYFNIYMENLIRSKKRVDSIYIEIVNIATFNAQTPRERDRLQARYTKTIQRLLYSFEIFDVNVGYNGIEVRPRYNFTSCILTKLFPGLEYFCKNNRPIFGSGALSAAVNRLDNELLRATDSRSSKYFVNGGCHNKFYSVICDWTIESAPITELCINFYLSALTGIAPAKVDPIVQNIQRALYTNRNYPNMTVYKAARHIFFDETTSTLKLPRGFKALQYFFNSTTIDPALRTISNFLNYTTGICLYELSIPAGFPCLYLNDRKRTKYVGEFEVLLPFGTTFLITDIDTRAYVRGDDNAYYRVILYKAKAIEPEPNVFNTDGSGKIDFNIFAQKVADLSGPEAALFSQSLPNLNAPQSFAEFYAWFTEHLEKSIIEFMSGFKELSYKCIVGLFDMFKSAIITIIKFFKSVGASAFYQIRELMFAVVTNTLKRLKGGIIINLLFYLLNMVVYPLKGIVITLESTASLIKRINNEVFIPVTDFLANYK